MRGIFFAAALVRGELIGRRQIAGGERLGEQADGVVDFALLCRGLGRLEIVDTPACRGATNKIRHAAANKILIMATPSLHF